MGRETTTHRYANTGYSMKDTSPEVNDMIYKNIMSLSIERRLMMGMSMLSTARKMILESLPADLSPAARMKALFERLYGIPCPVPFHRLELAHPHSISLKIS
jgi:hypothetical protein